MWLVKVGSERVGAKVVRYTLLTLIIFMLLCTILAIILVTFASNYSTALNDRTQGKFFRITFLLHLFLVPRPVFFFIFFAFLRFLCNRQLCHLFAFA